MNKYIAKARPESLYRESERACISHRAIGAEKFIFFPQKTKWGG